MPPSRPRAILLVDDDPDSQVIYGTHLRQLGYEVLGAGTGVEGVLAACEALPLAVVLDVQLPELDGLEATRRLKADPHTAAIPVILLTAYGDRELFEMAAQSGADAFLTKPCTPGDLETALAELLDDTEPNPGIERRLRKRS
jgi:CheY-like chemotaxis protein